MKYFLALFCAVSCVSPLSAMYKKETNLKKTVPIYQFFKKISEPGNWEFNSIGQLKVINEAMSKNKSFQKALTEKYKLFLKDKNSFVGQDTLRYAVFYGFKELYSMLIFLGVESDQCNSENTYALDKEGAEYVNVDANAQACNFLYDLVNVRIPLELIVKKLCQKNKWPNIYDELIYTSECFASISEISKTLPVLKDYIRWYFVSAEIVENYLHSCKKEFSSDTDLWKIIRELELESLGLYLDKTNCDTLHDVVSRHIEEDIEVLDPEKVKSGLVAFKRFKEEVEDTLKHIITVKGGSKWRADRKRLLDRLAILALLVIQDTRTKKLTKKQMQEFLNIVNDRRKILGEFYKQSFAYLCNTKNFTVSTVSIRTQGMYH